MYEWFKEIGIPVCGAVAMPLLVWHLTRYYGADKAEERRELRKLQDNLNLLVSIARSNIEKLDFLQQHFQKVIKQELTPFGDIKPRELELIFMIIIAENYFDSIDIEKYAVCITYDKDFVLKLIKAKNLMQLMHRKIDARNERIKAAAPLDIMIRDTKTQTLIAYDYDENRGFVKELAEAQIKCQEIITRVMALRQKITGLCIEDV